MIEIKNAVLVVRPQNTAVDAQSLHLSKLQRPTYVERVFSDLYFIHKIDHCKGNTFAKRAKEAHENIPRDLCKLFTDCCPTCISVMKAKKPVAGIKNIVTDGFGVRGQVDLIDFQSMPDGEFKFLLNYIDHGIKKLTSIPLVAKRASAAAYALLTIFTEQGPPSILQADNGGEFSGSAMDHEDRRLFLEDEYVDEIISEVRMIWPECQLVRGSPRHSESNGGVERVNQTVQKKLGAWMKENKSKHWAIGCKIVQWRYNTQEHETIKDTPYHLAFGQHPRVGISNLPIAPHILKNLSTESQLIDVYSNLKSTMTFESPTKPKSLVESHESVVGEESEIRSVGETMDSASGTKRSNSTTDDESRASRRARTAVRKDADLASSPDPAETRTGGKGKADETRMGGKGKADELDISPIRWMELLKERNGQDVRLTDLVKSRIGSSFPIIRCINTKDICAVENWKGCILRKIMKETWEVLDMNERDKVDEDLELNGDDGLNNNWGMYFKTPSDEYVQSFIMSCEEVQQETENHKVSPRRALLRDKATANTLKKANAVTKNAIKKSPTSKITLGDVVLVPLDGVDRTKVDGGSLVGVIVSINKDKSTCRVAVKRGVLKRAYSHHNLRIVPEASNNRKVMDLEAAFIDWRSLPSITEREAARYVSSVGGQGMVKCNCKGECTSNSCACKKAGRLCSSRCHRNNKCCFNNKEE